MVVKGANSGRSGLTGIALGVTQSSRGVQFLSVVWQSAAVSAASVHPAKPESKSAPSANEGCVSRLSQVQQWALSRYLHNNAVQ